MLKKFALFILIIGVGIVAGCSTAPSIRERATGTLLDKIKAQGFIRIGTEGTYPPFTFKNDQGYLTGFDIEVISEVAKRLGVKPVFVPTEWKAMFAGLDANRFDLIANQVGINDQRREKYDFSDPYTVSGVRIIVHKDTTTIHSIADLKGKTVGVSQGSNYEAIAKKAGATVRYYTGASEILADLAAKRIDAALNDRLFVAEYLMKNPDRNLKAVGSTFDSSRTGFVFRKGSPGLVAAVNKALRDMQTDGTFKKISEKWFGEDVIR
ncbi:ionotropic glutamate receptor [Lucifera butyrica]|uniref:Ionotropic glutamate receptor n=1 Tax=Lucifera butyrica TaxID=1351585 RepID=A0A498R9Q0_9FIRM|nr:transporter substrate-binding domain-containing protein [Lucifera butyrica]VBB08264.1 ionotropic glutamate receptor [Lucifera butyrica]